MQQMLNGTWRLSRGGYANDEQATMTLYGPGRVVFHRLYVARNDYLQFGGNLAPKLWGHIKNINSTNITNGSMLANITNITVPEGPQEVLWYTDVVYAMTRPGLSGWSFDFIPLNPYTTTSTSTTTNTLKLKLKLRVKGKGIKAWLKVKVNNDGTEAQGEVKMTHRRRRRG
mmetsp:Transcript_20820/g.46157  ORF Transcript_20820/g.46157 Transcript_20820/m.46157 type:complete len:171 (+) Transcript_20820:517-1029(+)